MSTRCSTLFWSGAKQEKRPARRKTTFPSKTPSWEELAQAADLIRRGKLVAFPTETVYGLGANALDVDAVRRIYEVKERPAGSPLIVHAAEPSMARSITAAWPAAAGRLAEAFWPGPLTLVLPRSAAIPDVVTAGLDSVGVRVPRHPIALELIRRAGVPIAAPSANRFTEISPTTAEHVRQGLGDRVHMILDAGPTEVGIESTVVSLLRDQPEILRPGMILQVDLEKAAGVAFRIHSPAVGHESPGLHPKHYAPRTKLYVLAAGAMRPEGRGRMIEMPGDPGRYAVRLYAELHQADSEGWDWIAVKEPPDGPEWAGILDRVRRASSTGP